MKKSELKEIIKSSILNEYGEDYERESRKIEYGIDPELLDDEFLELPEPEEKYGNPEYWANLDKDEENLSGMVEEDDNLDEVKKDKKEDEEEDVEDTEEDIDVDVEGDIDLADVEPEASGDKGDIQSNLQAALQAAKAIGDQKLVDQIGNTITFFTRTHIVGDNDSVEENELNEGYTRMKKLAGLIK